MTVTEALEKISKALALLTYQTRAENLSGMYSKNRLTEDLLLPIFTRVFKAPRLQNANQEVANAAFVDLTDEQERIAIQVTTDRKAAKITETLSGVIKKGLYKRYDRVIFFVLTGEKLRYTTKSEAEWKKLCKRKLVFKAESDIVTTLDLFPMIQGLPPRQIFILQELIAESIIGERYVDVEDALKRLSRRQLEYEKTTGKYIPDVFIETRETKNLARTFAHPVLFFRRTLESLLRINVDGHNQFLNKAGLPPLPFPDLTPYEPVQTLLQIESVTAELPKKFDDLLSVLELYKDESRTAHPPFQIKKNRLPFYEQNTYNLYGLGSGLSRTINDRLTEVAAARARIFMLTGRAGQGKTNLVCDFVENFLFKHQIPCAYLTGRMLRTMNTVDLGDAIQRLIFAGRINSFDEAARFLSRHATRLNRPLVLIIDGLNEHHRISNFADQLEQFLMAAMEYPNIRFLLTCRSEFFYQRFGRLFNSPLKNHIFLWEAIERRLDEESHEEMVNAYFKFFNVQPDRVSDQVTESLKKDTLLLRFFCEAYGARGKPDKYRQAYIAHIYREEIFKIYLENKLGTAALFLEFVTGKVNPTNRNTQLLSVLEYCLKHMLEKWQFANVPVSVVPADLGDALYALLDEELILRRDAPEGQQLFSPSQETINFTFDEFRDFLLAQYLLHRIYATDQVAFKAYVARNDPKDSEIIEGLKRFLFYASRHVENLNFWQYYRSEPWYQDVYDYEIFNIKPKLLRNEDRDLVLDVLKRGDERSQMFAKSIAVRWVRNAYPLLNLDLLLSVIAEANDALYENLIISNFKARPYLSDGSSADAFCKFIAEKIFPVATGDLKAPETVLFRLLILFLPVDAGKYLNSKSYDLLHEFMAIHPIYIISLLRESLHYKPTKHRAYVWRLLASASTHISADDPLLHEATTERDRSLSSDPALHREASRFLELWGAAAKGAL